MPQSSPRRVYGFFALMLPLLLLVSGCATQQLSKETVVWQSQGEFVSAVAREDQGVGWEAANQHPAFISASKLRAELAALKVKLPANAKPVPLFAAAQLQTLSEQIPVGLQQAGADQDLVFAVIDEVPLLLGLAHQDFITTGRVFYRDNRLNLILGLVREAIKEKDRRLQPFTPGSRLRAAQLPGAVTTSSAAASFVANRPDWIALALPEGEAQLLVPQAESSTESQTEAVSGNSAPAPATSTPARQAKSIEERLIILSELKAKELITEEEYRAKKESILKEL